MVQLYATEIRVELQWVSVRCNNMILNSVLVSTVRKLCWFIDLKLSLSIYKKYVDKT